VSDFEDDDQHEATRRQRGDAKVRDALTLLGLVLLAVAAYFAARHWQADQVSYARVEPLDACDLRTGPCRQPVDGGLTERAVQVEIRGLNMAMGLNRTPLTRMPGGGWQGETILPICSQTRMRWEAAVRLDTAGQGFEIPFPFQTFRP
jgi:hypothetical protein